MLVHKWPLQYTRGIYAYMSESVYKKLQLKITIVYILYFIEFWSNNARHWEFYSSYMLQEPLPAMIYLWSYRKPCSLNSMLNSRVSVLSLLKPKAIFRRIINACTKMKYPALRNRWNKSMRLPGHKPTIYLQILTSLILESRTERFYVLVFNVMGEPPKSWKL